MSKRILPIIVIYRCQLDEAIAYQTLIQAAAVTEFVVYDNSPSDYNQEEGRIPQGAHYFHDTDNGGLSKAYNYGVEVAERLGYEWVLLLDQDTQFPTGAYAHYCEGMAHQMLIVPNVVLKSGQPFSPCRPQWKGMLPLNLPTGEYSLKAYNVINSGCCLPVDLFKRAGGYKEDVRLDFSDYQFQRRLRKVSDRFYVLPMTVMQDFSNDEIDLKKLQNRFLLYLEGAACCECDGVGDRLCLLLAVLKHSVALSLRTHSSYFIVSFLRKYLIH